MLVFNPALIKVDESKIIEIESKSRDILRNVIFCKQTSSRKLLDSFIASTNDLTSLLSIKNAQMEAQSEAEARVYLKDLKRATNFIINEIKHGITFSKPLQLFQLFRLISPESHQVHPNRYRDKLVQVGPHICPPPHSIPGLVNTFFENLKSITNPILRAIYLHHEIIRIHPFIDANGRVTRIAKNWILMFELYPPIFIKNKVEKNEYISSLSNSFTAIEKHPNVWSAATNTFFEQELDRLLTSVSYIQSKLKQSSVAV